MACCCCSVVADGGGVGEADGGSGLFSFSSSSSSRPRRTLQQTTAEGDDDEKTTSIELYVMIPFICGLVGYVTNVLALKMTFYPLEFYPRCLKFAQVPGQPFGLLGGCQGIIPSKAGKMAEILVDLMTEKLIDVKETFAKLDSHEFAHVLKLSLIHI